MIIAIFLQIIAKKMKKEGLVRPGLEPAGGMGGLTVCHLWPPDALADYATKSLKKWLLTIIFYSSDFGQ